MWWVGWIQIPLGCLGAMVGVVATVSIAIAFHTRSDPNDVSLLPLYAPSMVLIGLSLGTISSGVVLGRFVQLIVRTSSLVARLGQLLAGVFSSAIVAFATTSIFIALGVLTSSFWGMA